MRLRWGVRSILATTPTIQPQFFPAAFLKPLSDFRKTDKARGGTPTPENALRHKDGSDGLRVHDLLGLEEL